MSNSSNVIEVKRLEKMLSYAKALGSFCDKYYNSEELYTPHGDCPFWTGSECVLQTTHPSDWDNLEIVLNNKIKES